MTRCVTVVASRAFFGVRVRVRNPHRGVGSSRCAAFELCLAQDGDAGVSGHPLRGVDGDGVAEADALA